MRRGAPASKLALTAGEAAHFLPSPQGGAVAARRMLCWVSRARPFGSFRQGLGGVGAHWALPCKSQPHPG